MDEWTKNRERVSFNPKHSDISVKSFMVYTHLSVLREHRYLLMEKEISAKNFLISVTLNRRCTLYAKII